MTAVCGGLLLSLRPLSVRTARGVSRPPFRGPSRRRVPRYVYDAKLKRTVPNPDPRPKSKVR